MILQVDAGVAFFEGDLTLAQASHALAQGRAVLDQGVKVFDLSRVGQLDSSAISLLLSLRRHAESRGEQVEIRALSESLLSLARLYGVADQL
ncbi:MAG: STAS domain-containing protein [Pseudomonadota bacterium]